VQHGDGVCCALVPQLVADITQHFWRRETARRPTAIDVTGVGFKAKFIGLDLGFDLEKQVLGLVCQGLV